MHPRIEIARTKIADAEIDLAEAVKEIQAECKHLHVYELTGGGASSELRRVCADCGLEERVNYVWTALDALGPHPDRWFRNANREEFAKHRVS